jgi:type III secretion system low calcium response chaperone LcrH/SycD
MQAMPSILDGANLAKLYKRLGDGEPLGSILGRPAISTEALYTYAYNCYTQAKYDDGLRAFGLLMAYNHLDRRFYSGFAACLHMQKRYEEALKYYGAASLLDPDDPAPVLHMAECWLALSRIEECRTALLRLRECIKGMDRHAALDRRIGGILALLE